MAIKYTGELERAVLAYLSELDNPVPDYGYSRTLRNRLREIVGAPKEPAIGDILLRRAMRERLSHNTAAGAMLARDAMRKG